VARQVGRLTALDVSRAKKRGYRCDGGGLYLWGSCARKVGVSPLALECAILTAARTSQVIGATWDEINLDEAVWTVPATRMKAGKDTRR